MQIPKLRIVSLLLSISLIATGCTLPTEQAADRMTISPADALATATAAAPLPSLTPAPTPSSTLTPPPAATPTITPSPTPNGVVPGFYSVTGCQTANLAKGAQLNVCVADITVTNDRHVVVDVTWTLTSVPRTKYTITKFSDERNHKMYLTDDSGKRYDHIHGDGAAYRDVVLGEGAAAQGSFDFGETQPGAFIFSLHDDFNGVVIDDLELWQGSGAVLVNYLNFSLDPYPLRLSYADNVWNPMQSQDAIPKLVDKAMSGCTIQGQAMRQPHGIFKNQASLGSITYDIYGYLDDATKLYVREYIYVSGLSGLADKDKPFIFVTIPADTADNCIFDVSSVLSGLARVP